MPEKAGADTSQRLRRILTAVGTSPPVTAMPANDGSEFLVSSIGKVIEHYRRVLSTHLLSSSERAAIEERIAREEGVLRSLLSGGLKPEPTYSQAA